MLLYFPLSIRRNKYLFVVCGWQKALHYPESSAMGLHHVLRTCPTPPFRSQAPPTVQHNKTDRLHRTNSASKYKKKNSKIVKSEIVQYESIYK